MSCLKGEANPLFYLQPCALIFLWFLTCFFSKAYLFVRLQLSLLLFLIFQFSFSTRRASSSASSRVYSSSSDFNLASSTRRASSSASICVCSYSYPNIHLASRARRSSSSTFNHACSYSSAMVMGSDVYVFWKFIILWHSKNWTDQSSNSA